MSTPQDQPFGAFVTAHRRQRPRWAMPVFGGALAVHVLVFSAMWVKNVWAIEILDRPGAPSDVALAPPPPPPPPAAAAGAKPVEVVITPKKRTVVDIVQPIHFDKTQPQPTTVASSETAGDPNGIPGGVPGGDPNGCAECASTDPVPAPVSAPPPLVEKIVPAPLLEGSRIRGEKLITPDDTTKTEIQRSGKTELVGAFKVCLNTAGEVASVSQLRATGFTAYDAKIASTIRTTWAYRPYTVSGAAVPVCTAVTFKYSQR